nr:DUF6751 family protein [uncultured Anaerocolumna sp.]
MYTNADITVYTLSDGYKTHHIEGVFWDESKQSNVIKSGLSTIDSITIYVPFENIPSEIKFTTGKDYIVKGLINDTIDNSSPQKYSETFAALKKKHDVFTLSVCDKKDYGSEDMRHYELACK